MSLTSVILEKCTHWSHQGVEEFDSRKAYYVVPIDKNDYVFLETVQHNLTANRIETVVRIENPYAYGRLLIEEHYSKSKKTVIFLTRFSYNTNSSKVKLKYWTFFTPL